jgi:hypothetical protein
MKKHWMKGWKDGEAITSSWPPGRYPRASYHWVMFILKVVVSTFLMRWLTRFLEASKHHAAMVDYSVNVKHGMVVTHSFEIYAGKFMAPLWEQMLLYFELDECVCIFCTSKRFWMNRTEQ